MVMRKPKLTQDDLIDKWLKDYHSTSLKQVIIDHPEWEAEPEKHTRDFYKTYAVTQEQHDAWEEWVITTLMKQERAGRKYIERGMWAIYLNCAPSIIEPINTIKK